MSHDFAIIVLNKHMTKVFKKNCIAAQLYLLEKITTVKHKKDLFSCVQFKQKGSETTFCFYLFIFVDEAFFLYCFWFSFHLSKCLRSMYYRLFRSKLVNSSSLQKTSNSSAPLEKRTKKKNKKLLYSYHRL